MEVSSTRLMVGEEILKNRRYSRSTKPDLVKPPHNLVVLSQSPSRHCRIYKHHLGRRSEIYISWTRTTAPVFPPTSKSSAQGSSPCMNR